MLIRAEPFVEVGVTPIYQTKQTASSAPAPGRLLRYADYMTFAGCVECAPLRRIVRYGRTRCCLQTSSPVARLCE
jgi:hypothetical protein